MLCITCIKYDTLLSIHFAIFFLKKVSTRSYYSQTNLVSLNFVHCVNCVTKQFGL